MLRKVLVEGCVQRTTAKLKTATAAGVQVANRFLKIPKLPTEYIARAGRNDFPITGKYKYNEYGPIVRENLNKMRSMVHIFDKEDKENNSRNEKSYPYERPLQCWKQYRDERKDIHPDPRFLFSNGKEWYKVGSNEQPQVLKSNIIRAYLKAMDDLARKLVDNTSTLGKRNEEVKNYLNNMYKRTREYGKSNQEAGKIIKFLFDILSKVFVLRIIRRFLMLAKNRLTTGPEDHESTFHEIVYDTTDIAIITVLFLAGMDTTSMTACTTLYHLLKNREVYEKVYQEIEAVFQEIKEGLQEKGVTVDVLNNSQILESLHQRVLQILERFKEEYHKDGVGNEE